MLNFREEMIQLSLKYPFIKKIIISQEGWSDMCKSFDKMLEREAGETESHIKDLNGSMKFENLFVEPENEE